MNLSRKVSDVDKFLANSKDSGDDQYSTPINQQYPKVTVLWRLGVKIQLSAKSQHVDNLSTIPKKGLIEHKHV